MEEVWKEIEGFEGKYSVSNFGRVWNNHADREVAQMLSGVPQYKYANLKPVVGKRKLERVHRLVAKAFVDGWSEEYDVVDHIDRDKLNNHFSNLRWTDRSGNQRNKDGNRFIKGEHLRDFVLQYEAPSAAYKHFCASLQFGLSEDEAIDRYEKYLKYGAKQRTVEWKGENRYLLDICDEECVDYDDVVSRLNNGYPTWNAIYNIPEKYYYSIEIKGNNEISYWYPSKIYFNSIHGRATDTLTKLIEQGYTLDQILAYTGTEYLQQTVRGVTGTIKELCKHFGVSEGAVSTNMTRKGMSLEEALFAPRQRVKRLGINGEYKSPKSWYEYFNIDPKKANNFKSKYRKTFKETFEYFGVDTSDMEFSET